MDGFTYTNIFETKGIEYIVIITFFLLLIPFWLFLNKRRSIARLVRKAGALTMDLLKVPQGLFFSNNHTWTHLETSGVARVGIDDLLLHLTGEVKVSALRTEGSMIKKGEQLAELNRDGKKLSILSPITGQVKRSNAEHGQAVITADPYVQGWICEIIPFNWREETNSYKIGCEATAWTHKELDRIKEFLAVSMAKNQSDSSNIILQDGGALKIEPLADLPSKIWEDFQLNFLIDKG